MSSFLASGSANGSSQTSTVPSATVTSTATATASSNVSQKDAQDTANIIAQNVANSASQNDANIISQTIKLSPAGINGAYSKYNAKFNVNYAENPNFLTYEYTVLNNNISLNVQLDKNIYNTTDKTTVIGSAKYTINFRYTLDSINKIYVLEGPYTVLQSFNDSTGNIYYIYKSGLIKQILKGPLQPNNYNLNLVKSAQIVSSIIQSVEIKNLTTNKSSTFTNVGTSDTTSNSPPFPTTYFTNFDKAILTSSN